MFDNISDKVTDSLIQNQIINNEDRELYYYGVQQGLVAVLNFITTIIIGCLCGMLWESIIYMISYIPLRHFAGGFHARTPARCYVFSILMLFSVLSAMKWAVFSSVICGLIALLSFSIISLLAPVPDRNKPLDNTEHFVYRNRARMIAGIEVIIVLLLIWQNKVYLASCISWCLIVTVIMMWMGHRKKRLFKLEVNTVKKKGKRS